MRKVDERKIHEQIAIYEQLYSFNPTDDIKNYYAMLEQN